MLLAAPEREPRIQRERLVVLEPVLVVFEGRRDVGADFMAVERAHPLAHA